MAKMYYTGLIFGCIQWDIDSSEVLFIKMNELPVFKMYSIPLTLNYLKYLQEQKVWKYA
jgi:hypothetical protein